MQKSNKKVKYPENLHLKVRVVEAGKTITDLAKEIGISRLVMSQVVNGHYKGINIVPRLKKILNIKE